MIKVAEGTHGMVTMCIPVSIENMPKVCMEGFGRYAGRYVDLKINRTIHFEAGRQIGDQVNNLGDGCSVGVVEHVQNKVTTGKQSFAHYVYIVLYVREVLVENAFRFTFNFLSNGTGQVTEIGEAGTHIIVESERLSKIL